MFVTHNTVTSQIEHYTLMTLYIMQVKSELRVNWEPRVMHCYRAEWEHFMMFQKAF